MSSCSLGSLNIYYSDQTAGTQMNWLDRQNIVKLYLESGHVIWDGKNIKNFKLYLIIFDRFYSNNSQSYPICQELKCYEIDKMNQLTLGICWLINLRKLHIRLQEIQKIKSRSTLLNVYCPLSGLFLTDLLIFA